MALKPGRIIPQSAKGSFWFGFVICLLVCSFIVLVLSPLTGVGKKFGGHGHDGYLEIAGNVIRGNGFVFEPGAPPVLHRPPFYPLLICPLTVLPRGLQRPCLIALQSAMLGGIAFLIFKIAIYFFGVSTAKTAVIVFLANPWGYWNAKNPMTPITQGFLYALFVVLLGGTVISLLKAAEGSQPTKRLWCKRLGIGVAGAALALSHGAMLAVVVIGLFTALLIGIIRQSRRLSITVAISGIITVVLITPWTYRNWLVFKRFVPITSNYGVAYAHGLVHWNICGDDAQRADESYEAAGLRFIEIEADVSDYMQYCGAKNPEIDAAFNEKMKEHISAHPDIFVKKLLLNSLEYYLPIITYPFLAVKVFSLRHFAITIFHLILWVLALVGILRARVRERFWSRTGLLFALIALYGIWYLPFVTFIGHSLYTYGTMPFLSILAARPLGSKWAKISYSSQTSAS